MDVEKLEKLVNLRDAGAISEEEYQVQKSKLLYEDEIVSNESTSLEDKKFGLSDNAYNTLLHLSQFCSYIVPILGIAAPVVLWVMNKDNDPIVDQHGRNVINWTISILIYFTICFVLMFLLIGFLIIWIPAALSIIFPIIGAIKANKGEVWKYPLSIPFL